MWGVVAMEVVIYQTVKEFLQENEHQLLEREAVSQLLLINAMSNQLEETSDILLFGKVIDKNISILLFCNVSPYNLVIYDTCRENSDEAIIVLADYITENKIPIKGLNANKHICDEFIYRSKCKFKEHLAMDIMELRKLSEVELTKGESLKATKLEIKQIARWIVDFIKEALGEDVQYEEQFPKIEKMIDAGTLYIYRNQTSEFVSMAVVTRQLVNGIGVSYVFTPKEHRGKGYAVANMYALSKEQLEKGNQFCTLFVDVHNPISNRAYKKVGYQIIEDHYDYRLSTN